jgi:MSHA biogenesis protein MshM
MIKQTFGITKTPFLQSERSLLPQQQEIIEVIKAQAQHGGLCVITGPPGVGKTVIKHHIEKLVENKDHLIISFSRTMDTYSKIIKQIADALELDVSPMKLEKEIISQVHADARKRKTLITIIDEAHLLNMESLRKLRLLFDRFPPKHNLILIGQQDLMLRLSLKINNDIKSRITFSSELKPLNDDDLSAFITRELEAVRMPKSTFEDSAIEIILRSAQGNLRLCCNLCYGSLLQACRQSDRIVDHSHVNKILIQPHWKRHDELIGVSEQIA